MKEEQDPRVDALARRVREQEEEALADLLRPLDADEKRSLADGVFAALDAAPNAEVIPLQAVSRAPRRRAPVLVATVLATALAAAAAFVLFRAPSPQPLAVYSLSIEGGNQTTRGDPPTTDGPLRLDPASRLSLALRPASPVSGAIAVRGFLVQQGSARAWDVPAMVGAGGVVRVDGTAAALFGDLPEGAWELVLMLGRPDALPDDAVLKQAAELGEAPLAVSVHRLRFTFSRPRGSLGGGALGGGVRGNTGGFPVEAIGFAGCAAVLSRKRCELGPSRSLRFFVPSAQASDVVVQADGAALETTAVEVRAGVRLSARFPEGAREARVLLRAPEEKRSLSLTLVAPEALPEALTQAEGARKQGELDRALSLLDPLLRDGSASVRLSALRQKARVRMAMREPTAEALFHEAIAQDRAAERVSDELDDTFALAYFLLLEKRAFGEARALLEGALRLSPDAPEGSPKASYYLGLLALETGDLREALAAFSAASLGVDQLGLDEYRGAVLDQQAELFAVMGRHAEASARLSQARTLAGTSASPCRRAQLASNAGWIALRAAAGSGGGVAVLDDAQRALNEALLAAREGCPAGLGNVLVNLALVALERGKASEARERVEEARKAGGWAGLGSWQRMVEARLLLLEGKAEEALAAHKALETEGERLLLPELVFEGALGRAEALSALGRGKEARAAFAEATRSVTTWARSVPLGEGRGTFLSARERGARQAIDFLWREAERGDAGAAREGMEAARLSLAGFGDALRWVNRIGALSTEGRARWEDAVAAYRRERAVLEEKAAARGPGTGGAGASGLEAERAALRGALDRALAALGAPEAEGTRGALSLPREGEALVVVHAVREGLVGFLMTDGGKTVRVRKLGALLPGVSAEKAAEAWLSPWREALSREKRIRFVLPSGLMPLDWHALPLDEQGAPLLRHAEVVYSLDLQKDALTALGEGKGTAVVIADPTEDLPFARQSAEDVVRALEGRGLRVVRLFGAAATHEAVRDALELPSVRLLHYAGHAMFEGPDGLDAALRLARRGRLSVADVMALGRVPEVVVLAGCDTARVAEAGSGLGLAQAFVLKGARYAVASPRPMDDALAALATQKLYAEPIERDPPSAYRAATLALAGATPTGDWASLRLLTD